MRVCYGCGVDTDIECTVTVENLNHTVVYYLCGYCGSKLKRFINNIR